MKEANAVTHTHLYRSGALAEIRSSEAMQRDPDSDAAASTMFAVPCWWSWKTAMLEGRKWLARHGGVEVELMTMGHATKGGAS
jgi:hypothetical protein